LAQSKPRLRARQPDELLKTALIEVLTYCLDRAAVKPPLIVSMMSPNGSVVVVRCPDDEAPEVLAEHSEGDRFTSPIGIWF